MTHAVRGCRYKRTLNRCDASSVTNVARNDVRPGLAEAALPGVRGLEPPDVISTIFVVAARGRSVSSPTISANQREFPRLFQPFRENDICEFESSQPSQTAHRPVTTTGDANRSPRASDRLSDPQEALLHPSGSSGHLAGSPANPGASPDSPEIAPERDTLFRCC